MLLNYTKSLISKYGGRITKRKRYVPSKPIKRITLHSKFKNTIKELPKLKILGIENNISFGKHEIVYSSEGNFQLIEEKYIDHKLNAENGIENLEKYKLIAAYDESINKFTALEGIAYLTSHTIVYLYEEEYIPTSLVTIYFFTKAKKFSTPDGIIATDDIGYTSKEIYVRDKVSFLKENILPDTIVFIDGPLIGGDWYVKMINAVIEYFNPNKIIPIFIVKNSQSSIVVDNIPELKGKYNSDMHWAYYNLKNGKRTGFFRYQDLKNPRNARIFCYLRAFNASPLRIEFHPTTFEKYNPIVEDILDIIYYLLLVQGNSKNPQIRPIAIAEKYARETIHLFNLEQIIKSSKLTPTINQERFGWST